MCQISNEWESIHKECWEKIKNKLSSEYNRELFKKLSR